MTQRRTVLRSIGAACLASFGLPAAQAQGFPARPIQFVVPFPAGGVGDVVCRMVGQHLTQLWGQPVLVEARPGASTVIGMQIVARAPADGHSIAFVANSFVINPKLNARLPYDGMRAFEPVASMLDSPQAVVVRADSPIQSLAQFLDTVRARPGAVSLATLGPATAQHIGAEMLQRAAGVQWIYTPFAGDPPAITALLGGHVDAMLGNLSNFLPHLATGKMRALAVTSARRVEQLAQIPTVAEAGFPGFEVVAWFGVVAPAGTSREVVARLSEGIRGALAEPDIAKKTQALTLQTNYRGPADFAAFMQGEYSRYARVIDEAKIRAG